MRFSTSSRALPTALTTAFAAAALLVATPALAQEHGLPLGWGWSMDDDTLTVTIQADDVLEDVDATITPSRGSRESYDTSEIRTGGTWDLDLDAPTSTTTYTLRVEADHAGERFYIEDEFDVEIFGDLEMQLDRDSVDPDATSQSLTMTMNQPAASVQVTVRSEDGSILAERTVEFDGDSAGSTLRVPWTRGPGTVLTIDVRAESTSGSWTSARLIPWQVQAIFDDVSFASGSAEIAATDVDALNGYVTDFTTTADTVSEFVSVQLYVGGYTDTVGAGGDNQRLSQERAESIAEFMRDAGFSYPIFYQGFGESALAESTADNVENSSNRRAIFVLGVDSPSGSDFPSGSWQEL